MSNIDDITFFDSGSDIAIFPEGTSFKGIFAYLRHLDGNYFTRYQISADVAAGNLNYIVQKHEGKDFRHLRTNPDKPEIVFTFENYFFPTHYSLENPDWPNQETEFMKSWYLISVDDDNQEHIIDYRYDIDFCGKPLCIGIYDRIYKIRRPRSSKKFILRSNGCSNGQPYLILRYIDIFGLLCADESEGCSVPLYGYSCVKKNTIKISIFAFILSFILSETGTK